jgi:cytochrome c biogenesis protein CcdA
MLLAYTVGVTLPFLVLGILFTMLANKLKLAARYSNIIEKVSAIIVIAFGILFLTNKFSSLTLFITHILDLSKLAR